MTVAVEADPAFVDSNVLVYAADGSDAVRQERARQLISSLMDSESLRTSAQVLGEFFVVVTRKLRLPVSPAEAVEYVKQYSKWPVIPIDSRLVREACELSESANISYWDALIVVAAARAGATRLYTEDLNAGQTLLGVEVVNPFAE